MFKLCHKIMIQIKKKSIVFFHVLLTFHCYVNDYLRIDRFIFFWTSYTPKKFALENYNRCWQEVGKSIEPFHLTPLFETFPCSHCQNIWLCDESNDKDNFFINESCNFDQTRPFSPLTQHWQGCHDDMWTGQMFGMGVYYNTFLTQFIYKARPSTLELIKLGWSFSYKRFLGYRSSGAWY